MLCCFNVCLPLLNYLFHHCSFPFIHSLGAMITVGNSDPTAGSLAGAACWAGSELQLLVSSATEKRDVCGFRRIHENAESAISRFTFEAVIDKEKPEQDLCFHNTPHHWGALVIIAAWVSVPADQNGCALWEVQAVLMSTRPFTTLKKPLNKMGVTTD